MSGTMLVTGATGVVGTELLATARRAGWDAVGTSRRGGEGIVPWEMAGPAPAGLRRHWDVVVHTAARPRWNLPAGTAWRSNVEPVDAVAPLVSTGTRFVLLSTAYATGLHGSVESERLEDYRNTYEWSKAGAERRTRQRIGPAVVIRPPLVIGRRQDGVVARFTGLYSFLSAMTGSQLPVMVADRDSALDVVSTTDLAESCLREVDRPVDRERIVVLGGGSGVLSVGETLHLTESTLNEWRTARGIAPLGWPKLVPVETWYRLYRPMARRTFSPRQWRTLELLEPFIPYLTMPESVLGTPEATRVPVPAMADCVRRCTEYWIRTHPGAAARELRRWSAEAPIPSAVP